MNFSKWLPLLTLLLTLNIPNSVEAYNLGIIANPDSLVDSRANWSWSIRGSTVDFLAVDAGHSIPEPSSVPVIILEDQCIPSTQWEVLKNWIKEGGILIVSGLRCLTSEGNLLVDEWRARIAGLKVQDEDPGLDGVYPRVVSSSPILSPFATGDGIRFDSDALGSASPVNATSALVLARGFRIEPGPGDWIRESDAITMAFNRTGSGAVLFLNFSLARVTACNPTRDQSPTLNCRAAGTGRALMKVLLANLLWETRGIQLPLFWETPGTRPVGVVLTGDVHAGDQEYQIRSARLMAERLARREVPITYFIEGEVALESSLHYRKLIEMPNVHIGSHSASGDRYDLENVSGRSEVLADIRLAEELLGIDRLRNFSGSAKAIRTHGWASNESEGEAWTAMHDAGISLVFDNNADPILPIISTSAPSEWFSEEVNKRLFIPTFEKAVHTEADDFILGQALSGEIFSLASPEPDPCCNWGVPFSAYADYVRRWHNNFMRLGIVGGVTEIWLWHPSTPVWKGGLQDLVSITQAMSRDERVSLFSADEVATWLHNRERVTAAPAWNDSGAISGINLEYAAAELLPLPDKAREESKTVSYWVVGHANIDGWQSRQWQDPQGRTITVLSKPLLIGGSPKSE